MFQILYLNLQHEISILKPMESNEKDTVIDRLVQFINSTGMSSTQFADKAGIPRPSLSQILHGRNKSVNNQILTKLNATFPKLDIMWLLFGQGSMYRNSNIEISEPQNSSDDIFSSPKPTDNQIHESDIFPEIPDLFSVVNKPEEPSTVQNAPSDSPALPQLPADLPVDDAKKISSIIVVYTDGSVETFKQSAAGI